MYSEQKDFLEARYGEQANKYRPTKSLTEFDLPELIRIEPIHTCNLRCVMCHVSYEKLTNAKIDVSLLAKRLKGLEGKWVDIGATHEPTAHPSFSDLVLSLSDLDMKVNMTTNGTLLTPNLVKTIADCNFEMVTISFDGCRKETYESIRRNANYEQTISRILDFKNTVKNDVFFMVNNTVMKRNMNEVVESVDFWETMDFNALFFIAMVVRDSNEILANESLAKQMDAYYKLLNDAARRVIEKNYKISIGSAAFNQPSSLKESYPNSFIDGYVKSSNIQSRSPFQPIDYFQNGDYPGMHVGCRSPFKAVSINYHGDVYLCQNLFKIGNIYEQDLVDIWYGEEAKRVRRVLLGDSTVCLKCEYYLFCINSKNVDYSEATNFFNIPDVQYRHPKLIEELEGYNIVAWAGDYYGIPQSLGSLDIRLSNLTELKGVFQEKSIEELKFTIQNSLSLSLKSDNSTNSILKSQIGLDLLDAVYPYPTLIEDFGKYNLVAWKGFYYGLPKSLGNVDLNSDDILKLRGVFIDISLERIKMIVQNHIELQMEVEELQSTITVIKDSKFWKIRQALSKLKQLVGL
ncbi:MAG: hypothetical protein DCF19_09610 [Pseudanabaena frigida]|uniref:Radical SAM core domain-containing protein n=1 Tax=Pseudanabaena frigida TaxID=945775 RepID=A0A2W4WAI6_9CYAN|nr:MAG: hypothetical protein DCF19_09610 [Pseudanabaena frigida]